MRFRIYYGDGTAYSGDPYLAPASNVQVIAQEDRSAESGYILIHGIANASQSGLGIYCWRDDGYGWDIHDEAGLYDYLFNYRGPKAIIFGRTIPSDVFFGILGRAGKEGING